MVMDFTHNSLVLQQFNLFVQIAMDQARHISNVYHAMETGQYLHKTKKQFPFQKELILAQT